MQEVQKQVGCRLRNLKKQEEGISGKGKLTDMFDRLHNYYGMTVRTNKNNIKGMQAVTKAASFHVPYRSRQLM